MILHICGHVVVVISWSKSRKRQWVVFKMHILAVCERTYLKVGVNIRVYPQGRNLGNVNVSRAVFLRLLLCPGEMIARWSYLWLTCKLDSARGSHLRSSSCAQSTLRRFKPHFLKINQVEDLHCPFSSFRKPQTYFNFASTITAWLSCFLY